VRKEGSVHPGELLVHTSAPDWRGREVVFRVQRYAASPGARVLVVDDWVETGSQGAAVRVLLDRAGATTVGVAALVRDCSDAVAARLSLRAVVDTSELPSPPA
jgi:adenine phosphoribosyltransferase